MKIAVVGAGISGLACAYLLARTHEVTLFEANEYLGGHTNTVNVEHDGHTYAVDTGFIVFNETNYPNFSRLLRILDVPAKDTEMSFSVKCDRSGLEYNGHTLNTLFAQRRNLVRPAFLRMLRDIFRFYRETPALLNTPDPGITILEYLREQRYSKEFIDWHLLPMGSAIWSTDLIGTGEFPLHAFLAFFERHGFLRISGRPQWRVVQGGSRNYVRALRERLGTVLLPKPVAAIKRRTDGVDLTTTDGEKHDFEAVVIATHTDQALEILRDATPVERDVLGAMPYQQNTAVLHTDERLLPARRRAWASWNYHLTQEPAERPTVTYNMNILQGIKAPVQFCVTLNRENDIDPDRTLRVLQYAHPRYDLASVAARKRHGEISGVDRTYYCGAYWGDGFHEDGLKSALAVCRQFGEELGE